MTARRDWYGIAQVGDDDGVHAWNQNDDVWRVVKDYSVHAELTFETRRQRREDWSGRKKYRVVTEHDVTVTIRAGYDEGLEYTAQPLRFYGGQVATIRKILEMFESGHLFDAARMDVWSDCRKAGATDLQLIEANDIYDWRHDERSEWENKRLALSKHIQLLKGLKEN